MGYDGAGRGTSRHMDRLRDQVIIQPAVDDQIMHWLRRLIRRHAAADIPFQLGHRKGAAGRGISCGA